MTAGVKAVGEGAVGLNMGWWNPPAEGSVGGRTGINEVEMVEEEHRGERDEED